jgi:hypothetical protein
MLNKSPFPLPQRDTTTYLCVLARFGKPAAVRLRLDSSQFKEALDFGFLR